MEKIRLSKLMSQQGLCSRREADSYIERGWVFVDGERISELGAKVLPIQKIKLHNMAQAQQSTQVTILLNKPVGYVSGQPEPGYKPAISLITQESRFQGDQSTRQFNPVYQKGLAPAGRLDIDSWGLLVLTQDGRIAKQLIGAESGIEKEYLVRVEGTLSKHGLSLLNHGLSLDGEALKHAEVTRQNQDQLRFILREGKKRQIRRMCELAGLKVTGLKRVRIGKVKLGELPLGKWRYLRDGEEF
jgi:23S rRNA pseudouridine2604 synthase